MKSYFWPLVEDAEVDDSVEDEERAIEIANTDGKGKVELKKSYGESDMMKVAYSKFEDEEKATFIPYGKRTENFEKSDEEREWVNLPADIISQILSGIPMESLIRCMFVCKKWYVLTKDPCFIELQLSKAICQPPLLILSGYMGSPYKDEGIFLIDKVRDKLKARRILKEIHGYLLKIEGSCNGLLCVSSGSIDIRIFVCNPITGEYIMLPKSKLLELKLKCWDFFQSETGFAFDPTCNKYKVVCLYDVWISKNERMCMGEIITLGQSSWREINIPYTVIHLYRGSRVVFLDGALHWLIGDTNNYFPNQILVFDINTEEFRSIDIPPPTEDVMDSTHLIKFENSLAVVQFSDNRMHLWKIVGNKTKGYLWNKDYFDISMMKDDFHLLYALELVDMLENGSFLLDVKRATFNSSDEDESLPENSGNLLLLCFPAKREYFHVGISGIRGWHDVAYFVPSLVSPCAAVAAVNGGCQRGI